MKSGTPHTRRVAAFWVLFCSEIMGNENSGMHGHTDRDI
uniref:Uncharacterized protein n=1 Tax=Anopheles funestus TaxID=62324 RepID=A0A182S346_ANOFN